MSISIPKAIDKLISTSDQTHDDKKSSDTITFNTYASLLETDGGLGETTKGEFEDLEPKRRRKKTTELVSELTCLHIKLKLLEIKQQVLKKTFITQQTKLKLSRKPEKSESDEYYSFDFKDYPSPDLFTIGADKSLQDNFCATLSFVMKGHSANNAQSFLSPIVELMQSTLAIQRSREIESKSISSYVAKRIKTKKSKQTVVLRPPRKSLLSKTRRFALSRHQYVNNQQDGPLTNLVVMGI